MHEKTLFSSHNNHAAYFSHGEKVSNSDENANSREEGSEHHNHSQYIPFTHHQHHHDHHVGQHLREIIYPQRFALKKTVNESIAHDPHENLNKFHTTTASAIGQSNNKNHTDQVHVTHRPLNSMHAHCHLEHDNGKDDENKATPKCQSSHAKFVNAKEDEIMFFLENEDKNELVRHLSIKFINTDANIINQAFDNFIMTRPWWIIKEEPYAWQDGLALTDESDVHLDSHGALKPHNVFVTYATLSRIKHELEGRLRLIAGIQYPNQEVCRTVPLAMGRLLDNGWASMMALYGYARKKYAILAPYISKTSKENEDTIFAPGSMCPHTKNKWNCAFLPSTNCSMPTSVTNCKDTECLAKALGQEKEGVGSTSVVYYDMSTPQGKLMSDNYPKEGHKIPHEVLDSYNQPLNAYQKALEKNYSKFDRFRLTNAIQYDANDVAIKRAPDTNWVTFLYGLLWRHTHQFRSEIGKIVEQVKGNDTRAFEPGFRCTAVHIRRGDRTLGNTDMMKYCADRERGKKPNGSPDENNCYVKSTGEKVSCSTISDLGCFAKVPFGALTLQNYLDKAWNLQKTKNIFLMTDATPEWLDVQMSNITKDWNVFTLHAVNRQNSKQGLNFFASVTMARKCGALVGNWFSGVSMLVHESMCFAHANKMGECPPTWDVGNTHPPGCIGKQEC